MLDLLTVGSKFTRPAIDRYLLLTPDINNKPAAAATTAVDRRDRRTDGRTLDRFMTLTACHANRVIIR